MIILISSFLSSDLTVALKSIEVIDETIFEKNWDVFLNAIDMPINEYLPTALNTPNHEKEKVIEIDAKKKIKIKINDPAIPKTLARLVKTKAPITPPDESCGNKSPGK